MKPLELAGKRFGRLTAVERVGSCSQGALWRFRCDCGAEIERAAKYVRYGSLRSCGCALAEWQQSGGMGKRNKTHGMHRSRTYNSWHAMLGRCRYPNTKGFHLYGGRGVQVCERWTQFENFLADMGERPDGMTLDRIDPEGHYEPGNCRWATYYQQTHNRRS